MQSLQYPITNNDKDRFEIEKDIWKILLRMASLGGTEFPNQMQAFGEKWKATIQSLTDHEDSTYNETDILEKWRSDSATSRMDNPWITQLQGILHQMLGETPIQDVEMAEETNMQLIANPGRPIRNAKKNPRYANANISSEEYAEIHPKKKTKKTKKSQKEHLDVAENADDNDHHALIDHIYERPDLVERDLNALVRNHFPNKIIINIITNL